MLGFISPSITDILKGIVPISRFNRGEAGKIFDELGQAGVKVVLKNNEPVAVLVSPEQYELMVETLEDYALYFEAESRMKRADAREMASHEDVLKELGISPDELCEVEVEID